MEQPLSVQLMFVLFVTFTATSAVPRQAEFLSLINDVKRDFRNVALIDRAQFAVALLFPDTDWRNFAYNPSINNYGYRPVIDRNSPMSPSTVAQYGNYLAARPHSYGHREIHSEEQILANLDELYNAFQQKYRKDPEAIVLYTRIVPCTRYCTQPIIDKLTSHPYNNIRYKVVVYSTCGENVQYCNVDQTRNAFRNTGITLIHH